MFCSVTVLVLLVGFLHSASAQDREKELIFDNYPGQKLTIPRNLTGVKQESTLVEDNFGCVFDCTSVHWCRSINFKTTPQTNGLHFCQLLSSDQFASKRYMTQDKNYNHYSIKNPCEEKPCHNDGECIIEDNRQDYSCACREGFKGEHCEKDVDECSSGDHTCHAEAICNNTKGSYTCQCKPGYSGNGLSCAGWRNMAPGFADWNYNGNGWDVNIPYNDTIWHFGPAKLFPFPVNSDHYEITSRLFTSAESSSACGHVFKYKHGSMSTRSLVTKAWGYFLWAKLYMFITTNGDESSPHLKYKYAPNKWYDLKTVVKGTKVKIYINKKLVKQVTMLGKGAASKTNNYVGLWCHGSTNNEKGKDFQVNILS